MKARLFSLVLLLTLGSAACAQTRQSTPRWSLDLLAGPAVPVGTYADGDPANVSNGPIKTGGLVELAGTYHLNRRFGIVLEGEGQMNRVKSTPVYGLTITDYLGLAPFPPTFGSDWKIARVLTGGAYTIPLDKTQKLNILIRILGGVQKTKTAGWEHPTAAQLRYVGPAVARDLR